MKHDISIRIIQWIAGELKLSSQQISELPLEKWRDDMGNTALRYAVTEDNLDVIPLLISLGVPACQTNKRNRLPIYYAISECKHEIARAIVSFGGNACPPDEEGRFPIHYATECITGECVRIVSTATSINHIGNDGYNPLLTCSVFGSIESARALLELGADGKIASPDGWLPIHFACDKGRCDLVKLLLEYGSSPEATDAQGRTPLYYAVMGNSLAAARLILDCGVSKDDIIPSETRLSMYELAKYYGLYDSLFG